MIHRHYLDQLDWAFEFNPAVAMLGPRQCGKTTLAKAYFQMQNADPAFNYFDCELASDRTLLNDPIPVLEKLTGLIVIDEVQLVPELFAALRVLIDRKQPQKFLILGSASRDLLRQSSETLAGRIYHIEVTPFSYAETGKLALLWLRGGFPLSFLAKDEAQAYAWRRQYIETFLERDIPSLGLSIPPSHLRRFWMMLAHYHGQLMNASNLANSLDISYHTVNRYTDILSGTFAIRQLSPWHENLAKRQVKSRKIYFRDSGVYHALLGIDSLQALLRHPILGASWEGFALESVIRHLSVPQNQCFFWRAHTGEEIDLLLIDGVDVHGYEFKHTQSPRMTKSMHRAKTLLKLKTLTVIYPGVRSFVGEDDVRFMGLETFLSE